MAQTVYPYFKMASQSSSEEREARQRNWLAPAGSAQERRFMKQLRSAKHLTDKDRAMVNAWLQKPDGFDRRNEMWWHTAKKRLLGEFVYSIAMERHVKLSRSEWHVAYLLSAGYPQTEIATIGGTSLSTIEKTILSIREKITLEYECDIADVTIGQIVRWFLGL